MLSPVKTIFYLLFGGWGEISAAECNNYTRDLYARPINHPKFPNETTFSASENRHPVDK